MTVWRCSRSPWTLVVVYLAVSVWASSIAAAPAESPRWRVVGQIGGPTSAVAVQGNYAYVGVGLRLVVLDVSKPAELRERGATAPFPYFVEDVVASGTLAFVAAGGAGLRIVDVSDPTDPAEVGSWDSPGYAEGVAVVGSIVCLADGPYGLRLLDVSDPVHPTPLGSAHDMNYAFDVAVSGHHAYLAAAGAGLLVVDVADPSHPLEVGGLDTPGYAYGVAVSGTLAYVADAWEGLRVVDVSVPSHPIAKGSLATPGWALNVAVAGSTVYVADGADGLRVVDVSNPANPHETGAHEITGVARRVAAAGTTAYVADLRTGLRVVDVADPARPAQMGLYSLMANARRVAVAGSYTYVAAGFSGLRVVDVSDPSHPTQVGIYDSGGTYVTSVVVSGTCAYLGTYWGGPPHLNLHVVDISNPAHPTRISAIPTGESYEIALAGKIVYCAGWGLQSIDVSDPTAPVLVGSISLPSAAGVTVSQTLAYVGGGVGLQIVDVSNPVSPTLVGVYDCPGPARIGGVAVAGDKAYAAESWGMRVVDVSDPKAPTGIGFCDTPGRPQSVALAGDLAYVSDSGGGLQIVDVSNPFTPTLIATYDTPGFVWYTALAGNHAYVADGYGGLLILEKTDGTAFGSGSEKLRRVVGPNWVVSRTTGSKAVLQIDASLTSKSAHGSTSDVPGDPNTCVVTSAADSGGGTLRQCLANAAGGDTITFDPTVFSPASPVTISLASPLPALTQGNLTIDASNAGVILNGSGTPPDTTGLVIVSDRNTVKGLQIVGFPGMGIGIAGGAKNNLVGGDRLRGSGLLGEGNLITGNGEGVFIGGTGTTSNTVAGNFIGTDVSGTAIVGNGNGINIQQEASYNLIGGFTPGARNVISGNWYNEVMISGSGTEHNLVRNNLIGMDAGGTYALRTAPWGATGVSILFGSRHNTIGPGNVINGTGRGVCISDADENTVIGNLIGTNTSGALGIGNRFYGVELTNGAQRNRVGPGNRIAYNGSSGVLVDGATTLSNTITANAIYENEKGISTSNGGNASLSPPVISSATITTVIGAALPEAIIEIFSDWEDEGKVYEGQVVADASGQFTFTKPEKLTGPHVTATATDSGGNTSEFSLPVVAFTVTETITVTSPSDSGPGTLRQALLDAWPGNTIAFDPAVFPPTNPVTIALTSPLPAITQGYITIDGSNAGVILDGSQLSEPANGLRIDSDGNVVRGLQILHFNGPGVAGIQISGHHNVIGGDRTQGTGLTGQGNVLSSGESGVGISGSDNVVEGNLVGTDASGSVAMGNASAGIGLRGPGNIVGGIAAGRGNVVSANAVGINLGTGATSNIIIGNLIGTNVSGTLALGNNRGVQIYGGASRNRVGGTTPGERNVISGNWEKGVGILAAGTTGNVVAGNFIGTDIDGTGALGNGLWGVIIECGASGNTVGGTLPGERNVISGNESGVTISDAGTTHNTVIGNFIGTDANGTAALGNHVGVGICGSGFNRVGGTRSGERNVIGGNSAGISIPGGQYTDNIILGNYIGTDASGARALGNGLGIGLDASALHDFVGGATAEERNVISGNGAAGVVMANAGVEYNFISGNAIGADAGGTAALGNAEWCGVWLDDYAAHNFIQGNTIAYNRTTWPYNVAGVYVSRSSFNTLRRNSIHSNVGPGIVLADGGNQMLPPPIIISVTTTGISGLACPGCTVEVFSDIEEEGRVYEGSAIADASGVFALDKPSGFTGPCLTATATDRDGNTSEFSTPQRAKRSPAGPRRRRRSQGEGR